MVLFEKQRETGIMNIDQAYKKLGLTPYAKFARQISGAHIQQAIRRPELLDPYDPNSELYRRIGSTTYWAVETALQIVKTQRRWPTKPTLLVFLRSDTLDQAKNLAPMVQDFVKRLGGKPIEMKCGGPRSRQPNGYLGFTEIGSQVGLVVEIWVNAAEKAGRILDDGQC
jgi:hypothetical protein